MNTSPLILNGQTHETGYAVALVPSPYPAEELRGIRRLQVWTAIPGSDGVYGGWDFWRLEDCYAVALIPLSAFTVADVA